MELKYQKTGVSERSHQDEGIDARRISWFGGRGEGCRFRPLVLPDLKLPAASGVVREWGKEGNEGRLKVYMSKLEEQQMACQDVLNTTYLGHHYPVHFLLQI